LVSQLLAHEIGYRLGARAKARTGGQGENVGVVVAGMLGLLAFVLALTLSYSTTRFNERRQGALTEANAIGTAWLRASAVELQAGADIARLIEDYTRARSSFVQAGRDADAIAQANRETSALQQAIWSRVTSLVRERPDAITASLMSAINEMFDASTAERFALGTRLPGQIFWLLVGIMHLSMASLGYQFGLKGTPVRMMVVLLMVVWTAVIVIILDLAAARIGNFRTDGTIYDWTQQGFNTSSGG
jgi:hypothetical protein